MVTNRSKVHHAIQYDVRSPTLKQFHLDPDFVRVLMGPLGSGKTTSCVMEIWLKMRTQKPNRAGVRRTRWLVVRNTQPELMTTTIPSWQESFPDNGMFGKFNKTSPITHEIRLNLNDGTKLEADVIFMGLDGPDAAAKIRGLQLTGAWINECREVQKSVVDMLTGRVGRFPPRREEGPTWSGIIMDTNMPDDLHYLYDFAEKNPQDGWKFYKQPGGVIWNTQTDKWELNPDCDNIENLPVNYYQNQLAGKHDDWISVYLGANYGYVQHGRPVYPEYRDSVHAGDVAYDPNLPIHLGADFGLTPACVIAQRTMSGQVRILREIVTEGVGAVRFAREIKHLLATDFADARVDTMTGDPAGAQRSQTDETTVFQILHAQGLPFKPAPTNNFVMRREACASAMMRMVEGSPGFIVARHCTTLRKGLAGQYHFRRIQVTAERYDEKPEKDETSHVCEALQYLMLGMGEGSSMVHRVESIPGQNLPPPRVLTHRPVTRRGGGSVPQVIRR